MIGTQISHYRILEKIGAGGMGDVYLAEDVRLHRRVALKFLPPQFSRDADTKARFSHEARAASALDHPNICTVYDISADAEGRMFMVMPYYEGSTLKDVLARGSVTEAIPKGGRPLAKAGLAVADAVAIAAQIGKGLAAAHAKGIIHRDIKPANIFITKENIVKILDFGIAKLASSQTKLTKTGTTMGTVAYMSPEQAMGEEVDHRTDIWSLGVILYEMLSGKLPFRGDYEQAVVYTILNEEPEPLAKVRNDVPEPLQCLMRKSLTKDLGSRFQTVADFLKDLRQFQAGGTSTESIRSRAIGWKKKISLKKFLPLAAAALGVLLALDIGGIRSRLTGPEGGATEAVRIAVLPFANLSGDPQQDYLSDGITQEMINQLGRLHPQSLSVIARTSVMRYKKSNTPIDRIGRELGIDYVLEGSAQREGGRIRITVELIQVKDQSQLWANTYERETAGILKLQSDVAGKVADALAIKLLPAEKARLANVRLVNPEAYDACLKGMQLWYRLTPADLDSALQYFEQAVAKDPNYAPAQTGIALVWLGRQQMGYTPPHEAAPKAREAAQRAIELDDSIAETHFALAIVKFNLDWDWKGASSEYKRAIELNPGFPDARINYSHLLAILKRLPEAVEQGKQAVRLDPYNNLFHSGFGFVLAFAGHDDEAIDQARLALKTNPNDPIGAQILWIEYAKKRMYQEALAFTKVFFRVIYNFDIAAALDQGFSEGGFPEAMKRGAEVLEAYARKNFVLPTDLATLWVYTGDNNRTLTWLEKGNEIHDPAIPYIGVMPCFKPLYSDPRFKTLLKLIGLPDAKPK